MTNFSFRKPSQGFTLIEFMIASILGLIVLAAVGGLYSYTRRLNDAGMARIAVQQQLRTASMMITRDARVSGSFGCFSMGQLFNSDASEAFKPSTNTFSSLIAYPASMGESMRIMYPNPSSTNGSFGVRLFNQDEVTADNFGIPDTFVPQSDAVAFYYGSGGANVSGRNGSRLTFVDNSPNQITQSAVSANGYVAVGSCRAVSVFKSEGSNTFNVNLAADPVAEAVAVGEHVLQQASLMRYMVAVYLVGTSPADPQAGLYRIELQDDGTWGAPELLVKNVSAMSTQFIYVGTGNTQCPSSSEVVNPNDYGLTVVETQTLANATNTVLPPVALDIDLTYKYAADDANSSHYYMHTALRGNAVCANRQLKEDAAGE